MFGECTTIEYKIKGKGTMTNLWIYRKMCIDKWTCLNDSFENHIDYFERLWWWVQDKKWNVYCMKLCSIVARTVCPSILLHFQLAFWGSSGWMSTKSFYHDKVDIWQILLHFKIIFSQPLISVCPSEKNIRFSLNHGVWKMSKMKDCLRTLWTCSLLQKFLWNRIGHI